MFELVEEFIRYFAFFDDALAQPRAIPQNQKLQFSARPAVIQPPGKSNLFAHIVF
jgi:hypothetical protein